MKCLVAINKEEFKREQYKYLGAVKFGEEKIDFGEIELEQPEFDGRTDENKDYLLLKVKSFSCNYRDKGLLIENYKKMKLKKRLFVPFGSEICAEVIALGSGVTEFKVGDRVMANCAYPDSDFKGIAPGIATNFASLGWQRLHKSKLIKAPSNLNNAEVAGFSLGAQTAASMIRRSGILNDYAESMICSSRSATSLFVIKYLVAHGLKPICLTTSDWSDQEKEKIYPAIVVNVNDLDMKVKEYFKNIKYVFDPFFDMNIGLAIKYMNIGGSYISCGLRDQHPLLSEHVPLEVEPIVRGAIAQAIMKNISILGNCLGTTKDLEGAIKLHNKKDISPIIDSQYNIEQGIEFIKRSFFDNKKMGKVICNYET